MAPARADTPYPDVAEFAARVASLYGLQRVLDVGLSWSRDLAIIYPELRVTGVSVPGQDLGQSPPRYRFGRVFDLADLTAARRGRLDASTGAVVVAGASTQLCAPNGSLDRLADLVTVAPLLVIATDDTEPVSSWLSGRGLEPEFLGRTRAHAGDDERSGRLIVVDRDLARTRIECPAVPDDFRVVAVMTAYNEEDVIGPAIEKLIGDDVGVYVIDNWSTDRTAEIARGFEGRGLTGFERFPETRNDRFVLRALLRRVGEVAAGLQADWCIHHDADERRSGPWPGLGLRDSLWRVDQAAFSAVDHTVFTYYPIDDTFTPGSDFEGHFRYFELGRTGDLLLQIKAWKNAGRVDLVRSGGHEAAFPRRRVFPYNFLLKHYPIRSQTHGERKIFQDRAPRWDPLERARGWHVHYDGVVPNQSFLRDPAGLIADHGAETRALYLPEVLTGAGLAPLHVPWWALGGHAGRTLSLRLRAVERTRPGRQILRLFAAPRVINRRLREMRSGR
jgi:hypothetical protein